MDHGGRIPPKALVQLEMFGDRGQPLLPTHHVGDPHVVVVNHVGKVIGRKTVALEQNLQIAQSRQVRRDKSVAHFSKSYLVLHNTVIKLHVSINKVVDRGHTLCRHGEPDGVGRLVRQQLCTCISHAPFSISTCKCTCTLHLLAGEMTAVAVVRGWEPRLVCNSAQRLQPQ